MERVYGDKGRLYVQKNQVENVAEESNFQRAVQHYW